MTAGTSPAARRAHPAVARAVISALALILVVATQRCNFGTRKNTLSANSRWLRPGER